MAKTILLVEDSPDDELFCKLVMQKVVSNLVYVVRDGSEAIAYLSGLEPFTDRQKHPLPAVLLLDLKLPKMDGFAVLEWVKSPTHVKPLVVVLSHSGQTKDISRAYELGAHSFLTKPIKHQDVVLLATHFRHHWDHMPPA